MILIRDVHNLQVGQIVKMQFETPNICPECKHGIEPVFVDGCYYDEELSVQYFCTACNHSFIARYNVYWPNMLTEISDTFPKTYIARDFPHELQMMSPRFSEVYNQAAHAENLNLTEICGLGYRKALEILIKDFCVLLHPDDEEKIKDNHRLDNVITTYLQNYPQIADTSRVGIWFGNDEAHYTRQFDSNNIENLKLYIDAIVYTIQSVLVYGHARDLLEQKYGKI
ncbi:MAG: DUF4145 domain-containing protein [Erysipelotrichaceae bacterium]|nr:DUF4145 domain-containing protein [Erysipelotrichaceae bacterium]